MPEAKVSRNTIKRLSHYARCLRRAQSDGVSVITSKYLSSRCHISAAAVRKDLSIFGEFGKQGSGYDVCGLLTNIEQILGTAPPPAIVMIGAGNMGSALLESGLHDAGSYTYSAVFDIDDSKTGKSVAGLTVRPMSELKQTIVKLKDVIAVIAVPPGKGQDVVDILADAGCTAILSVTLEPLDVPCRIELQYVEIPTKLDILSHFLKHGAGNE